MAQQKIYLSKVRDFGENLGDTFQFIKQEFKPLLKSFLLISGVFILTTSILSGLFQSQIWSVFDRIERNPNSQSTAFFNFFSGSYFLFLLFAFICIVAMQVCVASYLKLYNRNAISPSLAEVWTEFRHYFLRAFFLMILIIIILASVGFICVLPVVLLIKVSPLLVITFLLFMLPIIYMAIVLTPAIMIMVNEDAGIGESISRCFSLIKNNFWLSLGIYFVSSLIYIFAASIIGMVLGIFIGIGSYMSTKQMGTTMSLVSSVTSVFNYLFYIIFAVSIGLQYFNMAEEKDGFGMLKRLESLGSTNSNTNIEEQY